MDGDFAREAGTEFKAVLEIGGRTILGRTISALRGLPQVRRIAVIGPSEVLSHPDCAAADLRIEEGATGPENIYKGVDALAPGASATARMFIVTTDLPFLDSGVLARYLDLCPAGLDFTVPLIERGEWEEEFPGAEATFVKLRDGCFTTGCAFVATFDGLRSARVHIERVFKTRKSTFATAKLLGPVFVAKWLAKRLTVADVERKVRELLHCRAGAIAGSPPQLAYDIDYLHDFQDAKKRIEAAG